MAWFDELCFLLHHVDGRVRVRRLTGEHMAPGCTMGRRQAGGGSVMLWAMLGWETLGPAFHVDVTSLVAVTSFSRIIYPATKQKWLRYGLRRTSTSLMC